MDRTPVRVYKDKEGFKTPHSDINRVLNITPTNQPLSPKDVNVQTPLIFKPKKLQIPEIFSPISKFRNLQPRKRYTVSNDENCDNFGTEQQCARDVVTSTPIVPKRNRNFSNCIKITPRTDKNVKFFEKKDPIGKIQNIKSSGKRNFTNGIDTYRRNNLKQNLTNELKAVLHKKQQRNESMRLTSENLSEATRDNRNQDTIEESNGNTSFEEIKARFERVKSKAAGIKFPPEKIINSNQIVTKGNSPYSGIKLNLKPPNTLNTGHNETNQSTSLGTSGISLLESSAQDTGSNLNYYTAFPDTTNSVSSKSKSADPLASMDEILKPCEQKHTDSKEISGVQSIAKSLNQASRDNNGIQVNNKDIHSNTEKKTSSMPASYEKSISRIPKFNIDASNKLKPRCARSDLIRDKDVDRITYKLNLGPSRTLNSTSKEKNTFGRENTAKILSESKKFNREKNGLKDEPKIKLEFQRPQTNNRRNLPKEIFDDANGNNCIDNCTSANSNDSSQVNNKHMSEPRPKTSSFRITKKSVSESETLNRPKSNREIILTSNTRKRKTSSLSLENIPPPETKDSDFKITSEYIIETHCNKVANGELYDSTKDLSSQYKERYFQGKKATQAFNSIDEISNHGNLVFPPNEEGECPVNAKYFFIQNSNSRHCYCSLPRKNPSCPNCSTRDKSVKSSLETLGECFKFRRKGTSFCSGNRNNLKRSYSFVHVSVKGNNFEPKSLMDIYSLSKSFPKNSFTFTETESSSIDSKVPFPIRSNKKRKPLKHLTTEHHHFRETPKEGRTDTLKETEEIYDERGNQDVIVDVHTSEVYNEPPQDTEALDSNEVYTANTHSLIPDTTLDRENTAPLIPDFTANTENTVPLMYNATYNIPESDSLEQNLDTGHSENMKSLGIEKYDLAEKSEDLWLLSDEFFKQTKKIINNENGLKEITKGVDKVENELDNLSKLHSEIKDDLVVKWAAKSIQPSSSSDSISEGNVSLKDDTDDDSCIPMRNAANLEQTRSLKVSNLSSFSRVKTVTLGL